MDAYRRLDMVQPVPYPADSNPRIIWGKYAEQEGSILLTVSVCAIMRWWMAGISPLFITRRTTPWAGYSKRSSRYRLRR